MSGCKFLFMADHHVVDVSDAADVAAYPMWRPGDHAALSRTYEFIGKDPRCRDIDFALFGGDQINCGYMDRPAEREAELAAYRRTLLSLDLHRRTLGAGVVRELDFRAPDSFLCEDNLPEGYVRRPIPFRPPESRVIAIQGNHDTAVSDFFRECSFRCGDTRVIAFFAEYIALPAPPGCFRSTARISDEAVGFVEREMAAAAADRTIRHIVLASHWTPVLDDPRFIWPILDACPENEWSGNRRRLLDIAARYGCDLYLNGHEHSPDWPVGRAGTMNVVNCGSATAQKGESAFAIVEIRDDRAVIDIYSRATAEETPGGGIAYPSLPRHLFSREIPLRPLPEKP